jgi:hypothetical protein
MRLVPGRDELDGVLAEGEVVGEAPGDRRKGEVLRGQEELHAAVGINEVIEEPEVDVPGEASKEVEEVVVAAECTSERVRGVALVVAAHTLDGQVEAVGDAAGASAGLVDRPLPVDLIARPEDHPADRVGDRVEGADVGRWQLAACMSGRRVKVARTASLVSTNVPNSEQ